MRVLEVFKTLIKTSKSIWLIGKPGNKIHNKNILFINSLTNAFKILSS